MDYSIQLPCGTNSGYLQIVNLIFSILIMLLQLSQGLTEKRRLLLCLCLLPFAIISALFLHQGTNAALYYSIAVAMYTWPLHQVDIDYPTLAA